MRKIISLALLSTISIITACQDQTPNLLNSEQINNETINAASVVKAVDVKELKNSSQISDADSAVIVATLSGGELDTALKQKLYFNFENNSSSNLKEIEFGKSNIDKSVDKRHHKTQAEFDREKNKVKKAFKSGKIVKKTGTTTNGIVKEGTKRVFNVLVGDDGKYEKRDAIAYKISKTAVFWLDKKALGNVDDAALTKSVKYWEDKAFPIVTAKFGAAPMPPNDVDGEAKINLFLTPLDEGLYGYFYSADVIPEDSPESNKMDMLYINSDIFKPGNANENDANGTLIHEFQHMVNFNVKVTQRLNQKKEPIYEDAWLNEGLSTYAEQLGGFGLPNNDPFAANYLRRFFNNPSAVPIVTNDKINYGTSLMFVLYLVEQYGIDVLKKLTISDKFGIENVESVTGKPFKTTFNDWATAMLLSGSKSAKYDFKSVNLHKTYGNTTLDGVSLDNVVNQYPQKAGFNMYNWTVNYIKLDSLDKNKINMNIKHNGKGTLTASLVKLK